MPTTTSEGKGWTAGPWSADHDWSGHIYIRAGRETVASLEKRQHLRREGADTVIGATANANLIAAAPDLYEALSTLLKKHGSYINELPGETGVTDLQRARDALRKAEGKS